MRISRMNGATSQVRLAELVASLSLATDLGLGQPQEHVLRQTVIATRLASLAGLSDEEQAATFYVSLLAWVGCVADSHELTHWYGNDLTLRSDSYQVNKAGLPMLRFLISHLGGEGSGLRKVSLLGPFLSSGIRDATNSLVAHCQTTGDIAERLSLHPDVRRALPQAFERWDGQGVPDGLRRDEIELVMRLVHIADDAEVFHRAGGIPAALEMLTERSGSEFDPTLVDLTTQHAGAIFDDLDTVDAWDLVIDGCASLDRAMDEAELHSALETFADYADLKSPWFIGHSRAVAAVAAAAARECGASAAETELIEGAALVARLGRIGVSTGIWNKPGALTAMEWERVRTTPYLTERILCRQPRLAEYGAIAAMSYERMDGSGYPRGLSGGAIPGPARLLAAADVYQSLGESRPYREALGPSEREAALLAEASAGRLDADAVRAVLASTGHVVRRRPNLVAGLTARELEVLGLLVRGCSNKEIAQRLTIGTRTVGTHIEHIYTKIGVSTRGAAAMFAMRHGLVDSSAND